ncbi:MAG: major capsid protein [Microvirus sp.]|nr:MAG: major capsid protein [Microvirus sp.]
MKLVMCSIYDSKANVYHAPFASVNRDVAIRQFAGNVLDSQSLLAKFPHDFSLFVVGEWDDSLGVFDVSGRENLGTPSVMQHQFSQVPQAQIERSTFDRSHGYKTTFDAGLMIPIFADEALPGDTFNVRMTGFARLATPIFPIMDNMFMDTHFFAIPYRLVWANWEKFNGAQDNPGDSTDFTIPMMTAPVGGYQANSLEDYLGLPVGVSGFEHSALWHRAHNLCWNEWIRDQNMQDSLTVLKTDGGDDALYTAGGYKLQHRGKRHDYFTSCLPWPQKGPGVTIPLGGTAPVIGNGLTMGWTTDTGQHAGTYNTGGTPTMAADVGNYGSPLSAGVVGGAYANKLVGLTSDGAKSGVVADLSAATAATINSLRQAFQIQRIYERDARGGTRYVELLKAHWKVTSPDFRLQRPEFLGGGSSPVNVSPVPQTSGTAASGGYTATPQGNLAAMGTAVLKGHGFTHSFTEHCLVLGFVSVRADLTYQQGLHRMWSRKTRFDFAIPALNHLGEQAVLQKEIYCDGVPANDDKVFGYQERYAEYRYKPSQITGEFRSSFPQSLDAWHLSQDFAVAPVLDSSFIEENPPVDRVIAVPSEPQFLFDSYFSMKCARPMPVYGVPGMIDHF